ncbi:hypothetical protein KEM54_003250 [Ascosphaera aggregata]|nr:hypothetical protein KEM54_003250 [Ascosphaera aggregata]
MRAYEQEMKMKELAKREEEEDKGTDASDRVRIKVEQKKQDLQKQASNGISPDEEVDRIMGRTTPKTPKSVKESVKRQLFTTPTKATKRQRTAEGGNSPTPTNPAKRQRMTENSNSVITKQTSAEEQRAHQNDTPQTPPNQIVYLKPESAKTLTLRHSEGRQPYVFAENEQDLGDFSPAESDHAPHSNYEVVSGQAPSGASDRVVQPEVEETKTATSTTPVKDTTSNPPDQLGPATPSAKLTRQFELTDSEKEWSANDSETTEYERDAPTHSFGLSVEITASLGLKQRDADRGARAIVDERDVFANGVKIAGKGGSTAAVGTTISPRKRRSSVGDSRDTGTSKLAKLQERDRRRSSESSSVAVQSGTTNGSMARRDVSHRKPPSVRLAEIDPNETDNTQQDNMQTDHPSGSFHPDPFQKHVVKISMKSLPPPHAELGKLIPVQGSFYPRSIPLHDRLTSWGRGLNTSIRYPDLFDYRIPKYALEIAFWAPGIEDRIEDGIIWKTVPGISTILGTKASGSIYVNGIELRKENKAGDSRCFGKIYSGDIITIYKDKRCFLAFRCVFFHGEGRMKRPVKERPFEILEARYPGGVDPDRWDCRGGTAVSGTTIHGAGATTGTSTRRGTPMSRRASNVSNAGSATGGAGGNCVLKKMTSMN